MRDLLSHAAGSGIRVVRAPLPAGMLGCYIPAEARIYLTLGLTPIEQRCVLAHELGHVHYGHGTCAPDSRAQHETEERLADVYGARLLIDFRDYARAEHTAGDLETLADELGVTVGMLEVYRRECLIGVRGGVYARTRPEGVRRAS